jgi:hypothetical protein
MRCNVELIAAAAVVVVVVVVVVVIVVASATFKAHFAVHVAFGLSLALIRSRMLFISVDHTRMCLVISQPSFLPLWSALPPQSQ